MAASHDDTDDAGFSVVVHTPAPVVGPDAVTDLVELLRSAIRQTQHGVLISTSSATTGGVVIVYDGPPGRRAVQRLRWVGRVETADVAAALCDWVVGGAMPERVPATLALARIGQPGRSDRA